MTGHARILDGVVLLHRPATVEPVRPLQFDPCRRAGPDHSLLELAQDTLDDSTTDQLFKALDVGSVDGVLCRVSGVFGVPAVFCRVS